MIRSLLRTALTLFAVLALPAAAMAAGDAEAAAASSLGLRAIGAAFAIGLTGLGTGVAMSRIGASGVGAVAEDQKNLGPVLVLLVIPESILIFGFVIAFLVK